MVDFIWMFWVGFYLMFVILGCGGERLVLFFVMFGGCCCLVGGFELYMFCKFWLLIWRECFGLWFLKLREEVGFRVDFKVVFLVLFMGLGSRGCCWLLLWVRRRV